MVMCPPVVLDHEVGHAPILVAGGKHHGMGAGGASNVHHLSDVGSGGPINYRASKSQAGPLFSFAPALDYNVVVLSEAAVLRG